MLFTTGPTSLTSGLGRYNDQFLKKNIITVIKHFLDTVPEIAECRIEKYQIARVWKEKQI